MFTAGPSGNDYDECSQTADPEANRDEMNRQVVGHQTEPELPAQVGLESKRCHRHGEVPPPRNPDTSEAVKIKAAAVAQPQTTADAKPTRTDCCRVPVRSLR
jgi:hypothetical protein